VDIAYIHFLLTSERSSFPLKIRKSLQVTFLDASVHIQSAGKTFVSFGVDPRHAEVVENGVVGQASTCPDYAKIKT